MFHVMPIVSGAILSEVVTAMKPGTSRMAPQILEGSRKKVDVLHSFIQKRISAMLPWQDRTEPGKFAGTLIDGSLSRSMHSGHDRTAVLKCAYYQAQKFQNRAGKIPLSDFYRLGQTIEDRLNGKDVLHELKGCMIRRFGQAWQKTCGMGPQFNDMIAESVIAEATQELTNHHRKMKVKCSLEATRVKAVHAIGYQMDFDLDKEERAQRVKGCPPTPEKYSPEYSDPTAFFERVKEVINENFLVDYILDNFYRTCSSLKDKQVEDVSLCRYAAENKLRSIGLKSFTKSAFEELCSVFKEVTDYQPEPRSRDFQLVLEYLQFRKYEQENWVWKVGKDGRHHPPQPRQDGEFERIQACLH